MKKIRLNVKTKSKIYPIIVGKNIIAQTSNILKSNNINFEKSLIVVDTKIPKEKLNILKRKISCKRKIIQTNSRCLNENHFNGEKRVESIKDDISIIRDKWNIPHITAENKTDLFFAQGFVHAQDRLWQLEMSRRIGMGRLAESFGEVALQRSGLEYYHERAITR